jgi:hypothetical protein
MSGQGLTLRGENDAVPDRADARFIATDETMAIARGAVLRVIRAKT